MEQEIEAKFLNVDFEALRTVLKEGGATLQQPMRDMRRALIETEAMAKRDSFIRIRDEGHRTTVTYKQFDKKAVDGAREIEIVVSDFDSMIEIFRQADRHPMTYQESRREAWELEGCEVALDEWPWIAPYIEIEGPSEAAVKVVAAKLGFEWEDAVFGSVDVIYEREYPHKTNRGVIDIEEVRFGDPIPKEFLGNV